MKALITGGGIGGTVAAMALQKAGIEPVIFEAYGPSSEGVGAFLTLAVNGLQALQTVGVGRSKLRGAIDTSRMALELGSGRRLIEFDSGPRLADGTVCQTVRRGDLYGALRDEAIRRGIRVAYGKRLVGADSLPGGVVATFADGTSATGDLLIGADGLRSRVRRLIDPHAPEARYVGLLNAGGYARGVDVGGPPGTIHFVFGKRCFFGYVQSPSREVWWFANPGRAKEPTRAELAAITADQWRTLLLDLFECDATPAADLIRATPTVFRGWNTYDFPTVPDWHRGRLIIIGDAAHAASPASGQGASMAIEDAVVLAKCLRDVPGIEAAFAAYEALRRERVERVVAHGKRNGNGKAPGPIGRVIRDLALRMVFRRGSQPLGAMRWLFEHHIDWETPVAASALETRVGDRDAGACRAVSFAPRREFSASGRLRYRDRFTRGRAHETHRDLHRPVHPRRRGGCWRPGMGVARAKAQGRRADPRAKRSGAGSCGPTRAQDAAPATGPPRATPRAR